MGKGKNGCEPVRVAMNVMDFALEDQANPEWVILPVPSEPEREFNVTTKDGLTLIVPRKTKWVWSLEDRPYRSVILDEEGRVVSTGWPKFGNLGEPGYEEDLAYLNRALASNGRVTAYTKEDGSLAIRSVINGQVVFRTRGSFDGGPFGPVMRKVAEQKYPALLDPGVHPYGSLLFEFVSPNPEFKVVLNYPEDDLIFLGAVGHSDLRVATDEEMEALASNHGLRLVETVDLPSDIDELLATVKEWERKEGVVVRFDDGQRFLKVKSASYLALHRLKSNLNAKNVRALCTERDVKTHEDFEQLIYEQGGDFEMVTDARPMVDAYLQGTRGADERLETLRAEVSEAAARFPERRDFATKFAPVLDPAERSVAFLLLDGKLERAKERLRTIKLDATFKAYSAEDDQRAELFDA